MFRFCSLFLKGNDTSYDNKQGFFFFSFFTLISDMKSCLTLLIFFFDTLCFCTCTSFCLSLQGPTVVTHHAQIKFFIFLWSRVGLPSIGVVLDCQCY